MSSQLLSLAAWYFVPGFVTGLTQRFYYTITIRAGEPHPAVNSPRHQRDQRIIRIGIIIIYLLYTLYAAHIDVQISPDFYQLLGVPYDVTDKALQSRFRRLTVLHHPDKVAPADRHLASALFVRLQTARDILSDPIKRFAYDRFGPTPFNTTFATTKPEISLTHADYILPVLRSSTVFYVSSAVGLVLPYYLGYLREGTFWRYFVLVALWTLEVWVGTRPTWPRFLTGVVNPLLRLMGAREMGYLPFQFVGVLRAWAVSVLIAGAQLSAVLRSAGPVKPGGANGEVTPQMLDRLDGLVAQTDAEMVRVMGLEMAPFVTDIVPGDGRRQTVAVGSAEVVPELRKGMMEWLIHNTIRNDPQVRQAIKEGLERRQ